MLQVILLQRTVVGWEAVSISFKFLNRYVGYLLSVVQEVVGQIVADIAEDAAAVYGYGSIPVVEENGVGKLPEGGCQCYKKSRRHDESVLVHREVVMDAVKEKM